MKWVLLGIIRLYQHTLSPDHSWLRIRFPYGYCRFYPTCSEYAFQSIRTHGSIQGLWRSIRRLMKCHPWHPGGFDYPT